MLFWISLIACKPEPQIDGIPPIVGGESAFHRLTETQLNNALRDVFDVDYLPHLSLPPEVAVHGFLNNEATRAPSPYLIESIQRGIFAAVETAMDETSWMGCWPDTDTLECGQQALNVVQERAWRRPILASEREWIHGLFANWYESEGFEDALTMSLSVLLQSPDFLYLVEYGDPSTSQSDDSGSFSYLSHYEIASRLSFFLHDTIPDSRLLSLASEKKLQDSHTVKQEARRLLQSSKARPVVQQFFQQWLDHGVATKIKPDMVTHMKTVLSTEELAYFEFILSNGTIQERIELDEFWGAIQSDVQFTFQAEFNLFVDDVVFGQGSLEALLTDTRGYVSSRTARIYGVSIGDGPTYNYETDNYFSDLSLHQTELPDAQRNGILTQGLFLAGHSHPIQPAPVLRGVFIRERLLCIPPASPPDDIPAIGETGTGEWTTNRERYAQHTSDPNCASCHQSIDGLGFPFENYDTLGAWRDTDNGAPVDATSSLLGTDFDGDIQDGLELVNLLSSSEMVHDCLVTNLYRYGMHRTETDLDAKAIRQLQEQFWEGGGLIPNLLVQFVSSDSFLMRRDPIGEAE
ncbi:MAG: DUF1588 domain-containing protein [Myxococcota bacterium]